MKFDRGLGPEWADLATELNVPDHVIRRFKAGYEAAELRAWLARKRKLAVLPHALSEIGRADLIALIPEATAAPPSALRRLISAPRRRLVWTAILAAVALGIGGTVAAIVYTDHRDEPNAGNASSPAPHPCCFPSAVTSASPSTPPPSPRIDQPDPAIPPPTSSPPTPSTPTAPLRISVSATSGPPGSRIFVSGSGFLPNEMVRIFFGHEADFRILSEEPTDPTGAFRPVLLTVPDCCRGKPAFVVAGGITSKRQAAQPFTLTSAPSTPG